MEKLYFFTGGYTEPVVMGSGETVPGRCRGITCYGFDQETGEIRRLAVTPSTPNPSYVLADPKGPYLYCVNELKEFHGVPGSTVSAYEICSETGELRLLNQQFTCGADACHLNLSPDGRHLLAANYSGGSFCVFPILEDHSLGHASCVLRHQGKGTNPDRQEGPHPHQTIISPDGQYVYISDFGLDRLACYKADWKNGWLLPETERDVFGLPGQGTRHGIFDKAGMHLYVMTEMDCAVNVYSYERRTGQMGLIQTISAMPEPKEAKALELGSTLPMNLGAAIRLHPNGKWLYVSVRGTNHLAVFEILESGKLKRRQIVASGGEIPRDFVLSPNGKYLLAAHQDTDNICIFAICQENGTLSLIHTEEEAYCVTVLAPWGKLRTKEK